MGSTSTRHSYQYGFLSRSGSNRLIRICTFIVFLLFVGAWQGPGSHKGCHYISGTWQPQGLPLHFRDLAATRAATTFQGPGSHKGQYISLKDLLQEGQRREDQAGRQNRETDPADQRAQEEAADASWVCICCRSA